MCPSRGSAQKVLRNSWAPDLDSDFWPDPDMNVDQKD